MQVVILAAGSGKRFTDAGYRKPKPLIQARGRAMVEYALEAASFITDQPIVVCTWGIVGPLYGLAPAGVVPRLIPVRHLQSGAAMSLLAAAAALDEMQPVMTMDCDSIIPPSMLSQFAAWSVEAFAAGYSSTVMTFTPADDSARYSFVRLVQTPDSRFPAVVEIKEKLRISDVATCGAHVFSSWAELRRAIAAMVYRDARVNGEYYMAPVHRYVERTTAAMHVTDFTCIGTPEELEAYEQAVPIT
jgi:CTP:molybdopterin cytidylyltransferase MocA